MRIIGEIPHPSLKITVFKMGDRVSLKLENERYEQTYKLGAEERINTLEAIAAWADAAFMDRVQAVFQQMHQAQMAALRSAFPPENGSAFEEII